MQTMLLVSILFSAPDSLWQVEYDHIVEGLELMNLDVQQLGYEKKYYSDSFRLEIVNRLMDNPLQAPDYVLSAGRDLARIQAIWGYFDYTSSQLTGKSARPDKISGSGLESLITQTYSATVGRLDAAFADLSSAERDSLIYIVPAMWSDEADSAEDGYAGALHAEFGVERDTSYGLKLIDLLRLSQKLDLVQLHIAGANLAAGAELILEEARELLQQENPPQVKVEGVQGTVYAVYDLPHGQKAVIGGPWHNVYAGDFAVIIDLGGNDIYEGRAAGAVAELGSPVGLIIDLAGDDVYRNQNKLFNQGAALFGAALLWDLAGTDSYVASHYAQGTGVYGVGMLVDEEGDDCYRAGFFTQGGGNFGSGVLADRSGDDSYRSWDWTQGVGGPWGYGLILDDYGDDFYYAGGVHIHNPLTPDQYRSFSQGFGLGWRDLSSGGIGFLCDRQGNDKYVSEIYAQATSYWFSLGMLLDEQGNDLYTAAQYSQGTGIHLSAGALVDLEGDDHYFSRYGPSQGEGHDWAVGFLLDKDGDDVYYASGGQGIGLTNSVGIFVDSRGDDDYCAREDLSQGGANWARGTGGAGLFLDLQGSDRYSIQDKGDNNHVWTSGSFALGMDLEAIEPRKEPWQDTVTIFPELDTMQSDSARLSHLFRYASLWEVRGDIPKVRTARRMLVDDYAEKAVDHIYTCHFSTYDGLDYRAIEHVFGKFKDTAAFYLYQGLHNENDTIVRNSIYFLGKLRIEGADDTLTAMLDDKKNKELAGSLINSLGLLEARQAVPAILAYASDDGEGMKLRVAMACSQIADSRATEPMITYLHDPQFTVRAAATSALASIGESALEPLLDELNRSRKPQDQTTVIRAVRNVYNRLEDDEKTAAIKTRLTEISLPFLQTDYPALQEQAKKLFDEVQDRAVLSPTELFLYPENQPE